MEQRASRTSTQTKQNKCKISKHGRRQNKPTRKPARLRLNWTKHSKTIQRSTVNKIKRVYQIAYKQVNLHNRYRGTSAGETQIEREGEIAVD